MAGMRAETISIQPQLHYSGGSQLSGMYVVTAVMWGIGQKRKRDWIKFVAPFDLEANNMKKN